MQIKAQVCKGFTKLLRQNYCDAYRRFYAGTTSYQKNYQKFLYEQNCIRDDGIVSLLGQYC